MTAQSPLRLHWLDPRTPNEDFPPLESALRDPNGLLAIGGDLSLHRLLNAYKNGIFPWYNPDEPILWWSPDPRAVIQPSELKISRSLRKAVRREDYAVSLDSAFSQVIKACSSERAGGTWLSPAMQNAYIELFRRGHAHSVEVWRDGQLIGGLYGVAIGRMFFGESMFSRANDASKIAMVWFCRQLIDWQFPLIDCQVGSEHLMRLGAQQIARSEFQMHIQELCALPAPQKGSWHFSIAHPHSREHMGKAV